MTRPQRTQANKNYANIFDDNDPIDEDSAESEYDEVAEEEQSDPEEYQDEESDEEDRPRTKAKPRGQKRRRKEPSEGFEQEVGQTALQYPAFADEEGANIEAVDPATLPPFQPTDFFQGTDRAAYDAWALTIVESLHNHSDDDLPPILSFLYNPWTFVPVYNTPLLENGRQVVPACGGHRLTNIPWLPRYIPHGTASWVFVVYNMLGATPDEITGRIPESDPVWREGPKKVPKKAKKVNDRRDQVQRGIRASMDRFRGRQGGIGALSAHQKSRDGGATKIMRGVFTRLYEKKRYGHPLTAAQIYYNCVWDINLSTRTMRQPGSETVHRMFEPQFPRRFQQFLQTLRDGDLAIPSDAEILIQRGRTTNPIAPLRDEPDHERPSKRQKRVQQNEQVQRVPQDTPPPQEQQPCSEPHCNGACPACCPAVEDQYMMDSPDLYAQGQFSAQPALSGYNVPDDAFWEAQWTAEQQMEWDNAQLAQDSGNDWAMSQVLDVEGNLYAVPADHLLAQTPADDEMADSPANQVTPHPPGVVPEERFDPNLLEY